MLFFLGDFGFIKDVKMDAKKETKKKLGSFNCDVENWYHLLCGMDITTAMTATS